MKPRKWNINKVKSAIYQIHGNIIKIDELTYTGMEKRCRFIDKDYGEWWTKPAKIIYRKQGHRARGSEKAKRTFLKKYGVDSPQKNKKIREKTKQTCIKKYNVDNPAKNKKVREKMSVSMKEAHADGTIVEKTKQTCIERYGVDNPSKNKDIRKKAKNTCLERYGVTSPAKNKNILAKMKQTCIERYGVDNPSKNKKIIAKIESIMLEKYGAKSSMQNLEVARKNARAQTKSIILHHWKTDEEIVCIASYERLVVEYLNKNKINYEWHSKQFKMPDGRTYIPDCYLPDDNIWIEIKGYFRKDAEEKWKWFHRKYPNSELWNKKKLKEANIL